MKLHSLQDLKQIAKELERQRAQAAERERQARAARKVHDADKQLFVRAAGAVQPLRQHAAKPYSARKPEPVPLQHMRDEQAVLRESLSDAFDASTLLETDDELSYRRPGIGPDVTRKLRRGDWAIQAALDLHGLRSEQARPALAAFLRQAQSQGLRCVRIVHGKGLGSPGKAPVLKSKVLSWLAQKQEVLAFVQARPLDGGAGALLVLLQPANAAYPAQQA